MRKRSVRNGRARDTLCRSAILYQLVGGRHGRRLRRITVSSHLSHAQMCGLIGGASARPGDTSGPSIDRADRSRTCRSPAVCRSADRDLVPSAGRAARLIGRSRASASLSAPTGTAAPRGCPRSAGCPARPTATARGRAASTRTARPAGRAPAAAPAPARSARCCSARTPAASTARRCPSPTRRTTARRRAPASSTPSPPTAAERRTARRVR